MTDLVEGPTGWPRRHSRRLIHYLYRRHWPMTILLPNALGLAFFWMWMYGYGAVGQSLEARGFDAADWATAAPWVRMPVLLALGMGVAFAGCLGISAVVTRYWLRRYTQRYLEQPLCLSCHYPIPPERACPECGAYPPRHIAEWARRSN